MRRVVTTSCQRWHYGALRIPSVIPSVPSLPLACVDSSSPSWSWSCNIMASSSPTTTTCMVPVRGIKYRSDNLNTWLYPIDASSTATAPLYMSQSRVHEKVKQLFGVSRGPAGQKGEKKTMTRPSVKFVIGCVRSDQFPKTLIDTSRMSAKSHQLDGAVTARVVNPTNTPTSTTTTTSGSAPSVSSAASKVIELGGEVAFAGRSNVGKSSLLNALVSDKIARTSNTPGRTQELNFFALPDRKLHIVDLPGYGYAQAPKELKNKWNLLLGEYLEKRSAGGELRRLYVLVDGRHGLMTIDKEFIEMLDSFDIQYQVVLTKMDRLSPTKFNEVLAQVREFLSSPERSRTLYPWIHAVSALTNRGIQELRASIVSSAWVFHTSPTKSPAATAATASSSSASSATQLDTSASATEHSSPSSSSSSRMVRRTGGGGLFARRSALRSS